MKRIIYQGAGVAIATPFNHDDNQSINYDVLSKLFDMHIAGGTNAIIVAGTTGEASTMHDDEHISLIEKSVKIMNKRLPLIAGVGSNYSEHAVDLAVAAENAGADALLCVTPYYNKASQEGLYRHFMKTADAVSIPIILYNVPSRTQVNIAPATYEKLSKHENIVAVKECNFGQLAETMYLCGDDLSFYSGEDGLVVPLMAMGGKGVISVSANIAPSLVSSMTSAMLAGDLALAADIQCKMAPMVNALFCDVNPIPVKEALNIMGYDVGDCRLPLCETSAANKEKIGAMLKHYNLI